MSAMKQKQNKGIENGVGGCAIWDKLVKEGLSEEVTFE